MTTERLRRLALFGYLSPAVSLSFIFLGTLVDPRFDWRTRSLSSIGEATGTPLLTASLDQAAFLLFNAGLLLAGLLGLPFAVALWLDGETRLERVGVGLLAVTMLANAGVAVAYLDGPVAALHFPAALGVFFGLTVTLWVYGTALVRRTGGKWGLAGLWFGNVHVLGWVLWMMAEALAFTGDGDTLTYFAVPEFLGALLLGGWVALQARRLRTAGASSLGTASTG